MEKGDGQKFFLRDIQAYRESLDLGMKFLAGAVIDDPNDPDDRSIRHMYHVTLGGWNRPYMELAGQAVREAFLPYSDFTGDPAWENLARTVIVDGVLAHAACKDPDSPAWGLLCNCADPPCDYRSPLTNEQMVMYRLDRKKYLADHPECRRNGRLWVTFDSAEILMAAILIHAHRPEPVLEEFIARSWNCYLKIIDPAGNISQGYDDLDHRWAPADPISVSRVLWACGLMKQAGLDLPREDLPDLLAENLIRAQQPNGIIHTPNENEIVTEFVVYCIEGLFWAGKLLARPEWIQAARKSFDALLQAPHVMAGGPYFCYDANWKPLPPDPTREINHMSVVGQVARLAFEFHQYTGQRYYLDTYRYGIDLLFCFQDRFSDIPARGGIPRSPSMPQWREICPVYTYASALIPALSQ